MIRFTKRERIKVLENAVDSSDVKAVARVFRNWHVRVSQIKYYDYILIFQEFASNRIATDDMLDGHALYKM